MQNAKSNLNNELKSTVFESKVFLQTIEEEIEEIDFSDESYIKKYNILINRVEYWLEENDKVEQLTDRTDVNQEEA